MRILSLQPFLYAAIVYRLGHQVFILVSGVRFPVAAPVYSSVAQLVERSTVNADVRGSCPRWGAILNAGVAQLVEQKFSKLNVAGSNPVARSSFCVS